MGGGAVADTALAVSTGPWIAMDIMKEKKVYICDGEEEMKGDESDTADAYDMRRSPRCSEMLLLLLMETEACAVVLVYIFVSSHRLTPGFCRYIT